MIYRSIPVTRAKNSRLEDLQLIFNLKPDDFRYSPRFSRSVIVSG